MSSPKKAWASYDPITPTLLNDLGNFADDYFEITTGEAINGTSTPVPVCIKPTVGTVFKADGNDNQLSDFIGFIVGNYGSAATALVKKSGIVGGFTGLTAGNYYYVQDSVGTIGSTPGSYKILVGIAISTTQIYIMKKEQSFSGADDGVLNVSSGTTTINCNNQRIVVKVYNSITITGGTVAFTNPHSAGTLVIFKSLGDFVQSGGTIDLSGLGAAGGIGGATGTGAPGTNANSIFDALAHGGGAGGQNLTSQPAGSQGVQLAPVNIYQNQALGYYSVAPGSGGGGGGAGSYLSGGFQTANNANGGDGGRGGGAFILIVGGAFNFSAGTISVAGLPGSNGDNASTGSPAAGGGGGGGGGGAGGMIWVLYNILIANTGTYTVSGGAAGSAGTNVDGNGTNGGRGGGAGSHVAAASASIGGVGSAVVEKNYCIK